MADDTLFKKFKEKCMNPNNQVDENQLENLFQQLQNNITVKAEQLGKTEQELATLNEKHMEFSSSLREIEENNRKLCLEIDAIRNHSSPFMKRPQKKNTKENEEKYKMRNAENENLRTLVRQQEAENAQLLEKRENLKQRLRNDEQSLKTQMENWKISTEYANKLENQLYKIRELHAEIFHLETKVKRDCSTENEARIAEIRAENAEMRAKLIDLRAQREILRNFLEIRDIDPYTRRLFLDEVAKSRANFRERADAQLTALQRIEKCAESEKANEEKLRNLVEYYKKKYEKWMKEGETENEDIIEATQ